MLGLFIIGAESLKQLICNEVSVVTKLLFTMAIVVIVCTTMAPAFPPAQFPREGPSQQEKDMQERQLKEMNKKRQQDIRDDTIKLFQLASELKAAVDKTNENMLSLDVVRKADEVEKLAKKVKEKMKESIGPTVAPTPFPTPPRF